MDELTDALLEAGKGKYYTGVTDLHPAADTLAAFRDPINLNMDLLTDPDEIKALKAGLPPDIRKLWP